MFDEVRRVLVSGATGFTGRHLVPRLLDAGYEVTCFVRTSSDRTGLRLPHIAFAQGDIDDPASLENALQGKECLINLVPLTGTGDEAGRRAKGIVRACWAANVRRAIFVSSTSIFTSIPARSKLGKTAAERQVLSSRLDYTILRPTMIYGSDRDRNIVRLIRLLQKSPIVLVPGNGEFRQQPIHVDDVAKAIVDCLTKKVTYANTYNLSGGEPLAFNDLVDQTCQALGVKRLKIHVPLSPALWILTLSSRYGITSWIKPERILRLNEDRCFDHSDALRDFGFSPRTFAAGVEEEVASLEPVAASLRYRSPAGHL